MEAKAGDSVVWRSLLSSKELLQRGIRKTVGDGRTINIWEDNWIPDMENGRIRTRKPQHCQLKSVHELMKDGRWNEDLMSTYFEEEDCSKIKKIPISERGDKDRLVWVFSSAGQYTVKNGYAVAKDMQKGKRGLIIKGAAPIEIWRNLHAELIWKAAPICWDGLNVYRINFWHWWNSLVEAKERKEGRNHIELTINTLWQIWKSRNLIQFSNDRKCPGFVVGKAVQEWQEYAEVVNEGMGRKRTKDGKIGWGVVARCSSGKMVGAWAGSEQRFGDPAVEEARAIRKAMTIAMKNGWKDIVIQSDCKIVIEKIKLGRLEDPRTSVCYLTYYNSTTGERVSELLFLLYQKGWQCSVPFLARFALNLAADIAWRISFPSWLLQLAQQ
nr:uncharacterized protein LOC113724267 [Coffea arabica]